MKRRKIRVTKKGKKLVVKMTASEKRMLRDARSQEREAIRRRELERQRNDGLIVLLTHFINRHYGNPAEGRRGAVITGPVGARLTAASSLRALLIENEAMQ